jgi:rhamnosyltransferase
MVIGTEDTYVGARLLINGWALHYESKACVWHSHDYSIIDEFKRYFDIGVFYGSQKWIEKTFGRSEDEGIRYLRSEIKYLCQNGKVSLIPEAFIRTFVKFMGYRFGRSEKLIPNIVKKRISMFGAYWK